MTAVDTSRSPSHSASAATPVDMVEKDFFSNVTLPPTATRTHATTVSRCTSKPATRSRIVSMLTPTLG